MYTYICLYICTYICMFLYPVHLCIHKHTTKYYCWVNKRKQSIKASIRILSTEYNERRLFARSSCQTGIHKRVYICMYFCVYTYSYMYVSRLAKRKRTEQQDFHSISLSLPTDLFHVESLNFRLLFTCRQLVTHCVVGKLVPPTSPWPSPILCWHPLRDCFVGFSFSYM